MTYYEIIIEVEPGRGDHGTDWARATCGNMTKSAAMGLLAQFGQQYRARLFRGLRIGRLVAEKAPAGMLPKSTGAF